MRKTATSSSGHVTVKLIGFLGTLAGKREVAVKIKASTTVEVFLKQLVKQLGVEFGKGLLDPELNDPRPRALILVNEREIGALQGLRTVVKPGDSIVIVPVSHGG
jgi:molybdopterin converting factor small subunit